MHLCRKTDSRQVSEYHLRLLVGAVLLAVSLCCSCGGENCTNIDEEPDPEVGPRLHVRPIWSPTDSTQIAYTHVARDWGELQDLGHYSVWVVDLLTSQTRHVTEGRASDWSSDGRHLLVSRSMAEMWLVSVSTGEEQILSVRGVDGDYSPVGDRIAFYGGEDTTGTWILEIETMSASWVSPLFGATWGPDGTRLLCDSMIVIRDDGTRLGKIEIDYEYGGPWHGRWSPDGSRVVYGAYCHPRDSDNSEVGIWVANIDGSEQRLVDCPATVASWAPHGREVTYSAPSADRSFKVIWVASVDGTSRRQITSP